MIEIGGQDSKFILVDDKGVYDYSMNELCAAGTGAFLDVQAERLGIGIDELSTLAANAVQVPPLAGRCSVFAKSDIVHLQQRGVPVDQIVAGLWAPPCSRATPDRAWTRLSSPGSLRSAVLRRSTP